MSCCERFGTNCRTPPCILFVPSLGGSCVCNIACTFQYHFAQHCSDSCWMIWEISVAAGGDWKMQPAVCRASMLIAWRKHCISPKQSTPSARPYQSPMTCPLGHVQCCGQTGFDSPLVRRSGPSFSTKPSPKTPNKLRKECSVGVLLTP
jgi:hypothetical protein